MNKEDDGYLWVGKYNMQTIKFTRHGSTYQPHIMTGTISSVIKLTTPPMLAPFGPEKYNYRDILNLEFTNKDKNNDVYNFFSDINAIDAFLSKLSYNVELQTKINLDQDIKNLIKGKSYLSCIRPRSQFPLLRTHFQTKGKTVNTAITDSNGSLQQMDKIKGKTVVAIIKLGSLWATNDSYGINWITEIINIIN
jgi:hypothetical protein